MGERVPFEPAAGVGVEVDHAGQQFAGSDDWLVETALQFKALLVGQLEISALDLEPA